MEHGKKQDKADAGDDKEKERDYTHLVLKSDHERRPLYVCPDGHIFLEAFSTMYKPAYDFLVSVAEPVCRPQHVHEYKLTPFSLYAAVSVGLETDAIIAVLRRFSKTELDPSVVEFIKVSTENYGKAKLVLYQNRFFVESADRNVLRVLAQDEIVGQARIQPPADAATDSDGFFQAEARKNVQQVVEIEEEDGGEKRMDVDGEEEPNDHALILTKAKRIMYSFEINPAMVEQVKQRCLPGGLNFPLLEEYDYKHDSRNPDVAGLELNPTATLRSYQEKSLSKMFGNGRARSGIIVLPCGAGKSLTGIAAAVRCGKSCLVLCTNGVSVDQWRFQFRLWTNIKENQISRFTAVHKEDLPEGAGVTISTYNMISFSGRRSAMAESILSQIRRREWGLCLLDEVHVVPAQMFRKVLATTNSHCKLGLTATLVREDELIGDLNFLIGPKLFEANWLDLTNDGHIARVQCIEVWCEMTKEFYREYLKQEVLNSANRQRLLFVMNPNKFRACEFLVDYHERERGDKIIVFSDNIFALQEYATRMKRPMIYGKTPHAERTQILNVFKHSDKVNTVFLSKVGDNSIDIPEANVLIQISSHAGSRRQEAQRLGRILRAKREPPGKARPQFNAFFYTLVSRDTQEMYYSAKRQQFLVDQGYAFKVVRNLLEHADKGREWGLSTIEEQRELLSKCLVASEAEAGEEIMDDDDGLDDDGIPRATRRTGQQVGSLTGAEGLYMEYQSRKEAPPQKKPRHALFKQRYGK